MPLIQILRLEDTPLILPGLYLLLAAYIKPCKKGGFCSLPACPCFGNKPIPSLALQPISKIY